MGKKKVVKPVSEADIRKYEREWTDMMITIWRENIARLGIIDTGRLYNEHTSKIDVIEGEISIVHQFVAYGLFVARGVGKGYTPGNGGDLGFFPHRSKNKDWFQHRYLQSINILNDVERSLYAGAYMGTMSTFVNSLFGNEVAKTSGGKDITRTIKGF